MRRVGRFIRIGASLTCLIGAGIAAAAAGAEPNTAVAFWMMLSLCIPLVLLFVVLATAFW